VQHNISRVVDLEAESYKLNLFERRTDKMNVSLRFNWKRNDFIEYIVQRMNTIYRNKYLKYEENNSRGI
jgi:hypothetical protein